MSLNLYQSLTADLINNQDFFLDDEELTTYIEALYYPKALKKDRMKRFRNE